MALLDLGVQAVSLGLSLSFYLHLLSRLHCLHSQAISFTKAASLNLNIHSVVPNCSGHHGLGPIMPSCPWDSPSKNTGMGCHSLRRGIIPAQVSCTAGRFSTIWATFNIFETCSVFIVPNIRRNTFLIKHTYPPHQSGLSLSDWMNHGGREGGHMRDSPLDFKGGASPKAEKLSRPGCPSPLSLPCLHNPDNSEDWRLPRGWTLRLKEFVSLGRAPRSARNQARASEPVCLSLFVSPLPHTALWLYCCCFKPTVAPSKLVVFPKITSQVPHRYCCFLSAGVRFCCLLPWVRLFFHPHGQSSVSSLTLCLPPPRLLRAHCLTSRRPSCLFPIPVRPAYSHMLNSLKYSFFF